MNGESDRDLLGCISSNLPMYLTHCSIGSSTESLKLLRRNHGKHGKSRQGDFWPTKTSRFRPACAFKFRPIGYDFYDVKHPIFFCFWCFFFFTSQLGSKSPDLGASNFHQQQNLSCHMIGPYSKHPNCRPKTLRWLAGTSTPGETHCDFNAPFFCWEGGKGMALWATASTKEITVCRSVLGGTSQLVSS